MHSYTDYMKLRIMRFTLTVILSCFPPILLSSCDKNEGTADGSKPPQAVATIGMVADIVRNVAGDRLSVSSLIGEGVDPHLYKPTSTDVKSLQSADIIFYNGLHLEGKMGDVLFRVARSGKPVHAVTETLQEQENYIVEEDPHVWMDVQGWIKAVDVVASALSDWDPDGATIYQTNTASYRAELVELDAYAKKVLSSIPESQRVLVTAHDAFGYLGRAYGIEVRGIQGISTESEAGVRDIETLVTFLSEKKIPAIFVESSVSDKNIKAIAEGAKAKGHTVIIGGELFSDAMGMSGYYEGTYIGMIDHNVTTIASALGGEAPEKGLNGELSH